MNKLNDKKQKMRKNYKQAGITLIALVVTIIVLLILAGITINMVLGNNGLLIRAQYASERWAEASDIEQISMVIDEWTIRKFSSNISFEDFLDEKKSTNELSDWSKNSGDIYTLIKNSHSLDVNESGIVISDNENSTYKTMITFDSLNGEFSNNSDKNILKYDDVEVNEKVADTKHLYSENYNEEGINTPPSSVKVINETKTVVIEGASKIAVHINYGVGDLFAIKSVPQAEPALWTADSSKTEDDFEIEGDTLNLFFYGPLGNIEGYTGYYATINGYDENDKIIKKETGNRVIETIITEGTYEIPTRGEDLFRGWYYDQACRDPAQFDENGVIINNSNSNITVYAKWATETVFKDGNGNGGQFNGYARYACGLGGHSDYRPIPATAFKKSQTPPPNNVIISEAQTKDSKYPIYMWYDEPNSAILWYCQEKPKLKGLVEPFYIWHVTYVDFRGIDMSEVTEVSFWGTAEYNNGGTPEVVYYDETYNP